MIKYSEKATWGGKYLFWLTVQGCSSSYWGINWSQGIYNKEGNNEVALPSSLSSPGEFLITAPFPHLDNSWSQPQGELPILLNTTIPLRHPRGLSPRRSRFCKLAIILTIISSKHSGDVCGLYLQIRKPNPRKFKRFI